MEELHPNLFRSMIKGFRGRNLLRRREIIISAIFPNNHTMQGIVMVFKLVTMLNAKVLINVELVYVMELPNIYILELELRSKLKLVK